MRHREGLDAHAVDAHRIAAFDAVHLDIADPFLFQRLADDERGHGPGVDRHIDLLEQIRQRRHHIVMRMGDENGLYPILVLDEIRKIRNDEFHAQGLAVRVFQTGLDDKDLLVHLHDKHVLSVFVESAKRKNTNFTHSFLQSDMLLCALQNAASRRYLHHSHRHYTPNMKKKPSSNGFLFSSLDHERASSPFSDQVLASVMITSTISPACAFSAVKLTSLLVSVYPL